MIGIGGGRLEGRVRRNHLARNQILSYAEMFKRPLGLCPSQLGTRHIDFTETVGFFPYAHYRHVAGCTHCVHCLLLPLPDAASALRMPKSKVSPGTLTTF